MHGFWDILYDPYKHSVSDQTPQNVESDQCFHGVLTGISIRNRIKIKSIPDTPKIGNGLVQLIKMDGSTRQIWVNLVILHEDAQEMTVIKGT